MRLIMLMCSSLRDKSTHSNSCGCSAMMALFWQGAVLLSLAAAGSVYADMKLNCWPDFVMLVWTESRSQADFARFRLGNCSPTSFTASEAVFNVYFSNCNFRRLITGDRLMYTNELSYVSSPGSDLAHTITHLVVCSYKRPKGWRPQIYDAVFNTYSQGHLEFHISLGSDDFSSPAASTTFPLGSLMPIMASVEQKAHHPLLLLLEECVATTTPKLQPDSKVYPLITNKGCLVDSKTSHSTFKPRKKASEIHLALQAFRFALGQEVFIHCQLGVWDPADLDPAKKACHYVKHHGWELMDNPKKSNLCNCCDSTCKSRSLRSIAPGTLGMVHNALLEPQIITEGIS
ncbi:zona pellucida sperm-binding protein 3-like [Betta splendens]|uniref:Zona pellucida sperm-binding protein 3-like n=1 Tax=Betta splendens TaxID=158456 RepID=A0A6P7L506_BETSP|nr:zona pellucida sperm-binding protein 3-like [Betta splendens]XP_055359694.1 zona pellucida sperm-binding protein 3-like [Betta splendens]